MRSVCSAGAIPKRSPEKSATAAENARTVPFRWMPSARGRSEGANESSAERPSRARTSPATPPSTATMTLSVRSWRTMRARPAPIAARIETSRMRPSPRTRRRFATFAHAMRSTMPTAPSMT